MYKFYFSNSKASTNILSTLLLILIIVLMAFVSIHFLNKIKSYTQVNVGRALDTVLKTTQGALHVWADFQIADITELSTDPQLISLVQQLTIRTKSNHSNSTDLADSRNKTPISTAKISEKITRFLQPHLSLRNHKNYLLLSSKREILASLHSDLIGQKFIFSLQRQSFLQRAYQGEIVLIPTTKSDPNLPSSKDNNSVIFIVAPIKNHHEQVIALLAFEIDPWVRFTKLTQLGQLGQSGETYAFNNEGLLISQSRFDEQLKRIGLVAADSTSVLSIHIVDPGVNLLLSPSSRVLPTNLPLTLMAKAATKGRSGHNTNGYHDYRGVKVFGAWLWDDYLGFGLATEIDVSEALVPFHSARNIILLSLSIIVLLFISFVIFVVRSHNKEQLYLTQENERNEVLVTSKTKELLIAKNNLEQANIELTNLVKIDALTQLANRRYFDEHLSKEIKRCARDKRPLSLLFMDIDYFKLYNDHYGHLKGDECLQQISQAFKNLNFEQRTDDLIARYGGEEFILILSGATNEYAVECAKRIIATIEKLQLPHIASNVNNIDYVTLSIGIATEAPVERSLGKSIIDKADQALYQAKNNGRNQYFNYALGSTS